MTLLLNPIWWFSFAGEVWPWWLACALIGVVAWPIATRVFAGLADHGAGLSIGLGIMATMWIAWILAHPYSGKALAFRALYVLAGGALVVYRRRRDGLLPIG